MVVSPKGSIIRKSVFGNNLGRLLEDYGSFMNIVSIMLFCIVG